MSRTGFRGGGRRAANRPLATRPSRADRKRSSTITTGGWTPTEVLPLTSQAEAQIHAINRSIAFQAQRRQDQQQVQFELNQLRDELNRAYPFRHA